MDQFRWNQTPSFEIYHGLSYAFAVFNEELFGSNLSPCIITLRGRGKRHGYHNARRFVSLNGQLVDELALNPGFFIVQPVELALSTLVHEMVHHWQVNLGRPSKSNPHNKEWVDKMIEVGLVPSSTGLPGGKRTGHSVSDYIDPNGKFLVACSKLIESGYKIPWFDRHAAISVEKAVAHIEALESHGIRNEYEQVPAIANAETLVGKAALIEPLPSVRRSRIKFECVDCDTKAWADSKTEILCGICREPLIDKNFYSEK